MGNKTALEQAIATIQSSLDSWKDLLAKEPYNGWIGGICKEKQVAIDLLISLLPTEKQQIVDAVTYGNRQDAYDGTETLGETYYNETFNKEK